MVLHGTSDRLQMTACRSPTCDAGDGHQTTLALPCGYSHPYRLLPVCRDRLPIEVKGLTVAPGAAVNGADFTSDEAAATMRVAAGAETLP